jgi:hypothetical protein
LHLEVTKRTSRFGTVGLRRPLICLLRYLPVHDLRVLLEEFEVGANAAASWAAHSYHSEYHGVVGGIGGVGAVSRSGPDAAADKVRALASLHTIRKLSKQDIKMSPT